MASVSDPVRPLDDPEWGEIRRVDRAERMEVLGLLLTGRATASGTAVDQFLQYTADQGLDTSELWASFSRGKATVAALVVPSPGRTAMIFLSPMADDRLVSSASRFIRVVMSRINMDRIGLVQALLEPGQQFESRALMGGGFRMLAHLVYMGRRTTGTGVELVPDAGDTLLHWTDERREAFSRAILATYKNTLDCPGLLGLRDIDDVIDGHKATGRFDPHLWHALYRGDEPMAVMLLSDLPQRDAIEMVYLGVAEAYRGSGLAQRLVDHSLYLARQRQRGNLLLAVDEHNPPALKLYRRNGYEAQTRKTALVFTAGDVRSGIERS